MKNMIRRIIQIRLDTTVTMVTEKTPMRGRAAVEPAVLDQFGRDRVKSLDDADVVDKRFTGAVDHARVPEFLQAMDAGIAPYLPSDDFYFSPIKVYEYLAAGLPVVASDIGQIRQLARDGYVMPARPGDAGALETALDALLADPDAARAMAARGCAWTLKERTWEANAARLIELARSLAGAPS